MERYEIEITESEEGVQRVLPFPARLLVAGRTKAEARENIRCAIEDYLEAVASVRGSAALRWTG